MTNDEKITLLFQGTNEIKNIDYLKELIARLEKNELQTPIKSYEEGFEDYWVVYDTNLLSKNDRIACIRENIETNQIVIALHDFFDYLPQNVKHFILHHEVGHILNKHTFIDDEESAQYKEDRKSFMDKGAVHPDEVLCDIYAVSRMGKERTIQALDYLIERSKTSNELVLRKEILINI